MYRQYECIQYKQDLKKLTKSQENSGSGWIERELRQFFNG